MTGTLVEGIRQKLSSVQAQNDILFVLIKSSLYFVSQNFLPQPCHHSIHVMQVVYGEQGGCQRLFCLDEVVQVRQAARSKRGAEVDETPLRLRSRSCVLPFLKASDSVTAG